ncbi:MAG: hypothetical protein JWM87_2264 [Candidatus Eremiobacteraeota bacterium]|nr:hypothetical protein [Candidatus Eremiobacteraeota bacterium]
MSRHDVLIGAVFAGAIAWIAWRVRALTPGGAVAAFVVGTLTYATGTIAFTLVLLAFFVPSVVLSRFGRARKRGLADVGKHDARDAMQVLANGGVATVCAIGWAVTHDVRWAVAFAGAYAAATADTWATEIGTLARRPPRSILTLRPVATGMSGGITLPGTLAEIVGAVWLAAVAAVAIRVFLLEPYAPLHTVDINALRAALALTPFEHWHGGLRSALGVAFAGVLGATLDSVLGATGQELRRCDVCDRACETDPHACGNPTRLIRGVGGFSNDVVNLLATAAGAAVAFVLA